MRARSIFSVLAATLLLAGCDQESPIRVSSQSTTNDPGAIEPVAAPFTMHMRGSGGPEVIDFEDLDPGAIISEVYGSNGSGPIAVFGVSPFFAPDVNAAIVFDSSNPTGEDFDLGSPADGCGGGPGEGGPEVGLGTEFANCQALGHIAIIAEDLIDEDNDDLVDDPDDIKSPAVDGANVTFDFSAIAPVTMHSIGIIDLDGNAPDPRVEMYDENDNLLSSVPLPNEMPNNGFADVSLGDQEGVWKMIVHLQGSGGFDSIFFTDEREIPGDCRVTGGGVDEFGTWDGRMAKGHHRRGDDGENRYQFGGQAGAPTGAQPQPWGEWTHHQQRGVDGSFVFHAGTASAPEGTEIDLIVCSDGPNCFPARPAPHRQIDFEGVGTFRNVRHPSAPLEHVVAGETYHWFEVHIEDLGEPGNGGHQDPPAEFCPEAGSAGGSANCECPDFYHITIYQGVAFGEAPNKTDVIYEVYGYLDGGNLQIHPSLD